MFRSRKKPSAVANQAAGLAGQKGGSLKVGGNEKQ